MARARVRVWNDEEGWGVLTTPDAPGEVWAHVMHIEMDGYRQLRAGQEVELEWMHVPGGQDGYDYRATRVRPL